eukprot:733058_1
MNFVLAFIVLVPRFVHAAYPSPLTWGEGCGKDLLCATLEFCQSGSSTYGYRLPNDTTACGEKPGPLIRMTPGSKYKLTLKNTADGSTITNVHTHGLHIVGDGDSDDVTRFVEGGSCLDYTWDIGSDHPGGTYWYHPHHHKSTDAQTAGGAFGMIIIEDDYDEIEAWARPENEKLLQISSTDSDVLGNGNGSEFIRIEKHRWYRLRMSVVDPRAKPKNVNFVNEDCIIYKVASDGVWHAAPFDTYSGFSFELTGASRADFAIKCAGEADTKIKWGSAVAATIRADPGLGTGMEGDDLGSPPPRPSSLTGLSASDVDEEIYEIKLSATAINGVKWDETLTEGLGDIAFGKVYEWQISGSNAHPFHLHLYHMLIVESGGCGAHKEGEFYDTISTNTDCNVRFKTADFGQLMIMHCHVLAHEDKGAITWMNVTGVPDNHQNNVDSPAYTCTSSPALTSPPTVPPPPGPTNSPSGSPTMDCASSGSYCQNDTECCSGKCKGDSCRGNRLLRA